MDVVASSKSGLVLAMTVMTMMTIAVILVASSIVGQVIASSASSVRDTIPGSDEINKNVKGIKEKDHIKESVNGLIDKVKEKSIKLHDSAMAAIQNTRG